MCQWCLALSNMKRLLSPFFATKIKLKPIRGYEFSDLLSSTDSKVTGYSLFLNEKSIFITLLFLCTDPTALWGQSLNILDFEIIAQGSEMLGHDT